MEIKFQSINDKTKMRDHPSPMKRFLSHQTDPSIPFSFPWKLLGRMVTLDESLAWVSFPVWSQSHHLIMHSLHNFNKRSRKLAIETYFWYQLDKRKGKKDYLWKQWKQDINFINGKLLLCSSSGTKGSKHNGQSPSGWFMIESFSTAS